MAPCVVSVEPFWFFDRFISKHASAEIVGKRDLTIVKFVSSRT